ncbi:hypothetical protein RBB75_07395 [Tunturibacter empetritectus]|uniref:Glycosyl hydrolase family 32 N-terminal domain-containing protein n=1 Tax=Tunturiibacter empetritectus TaxID=3069691 RepID=A0AAU7ZIH7_9BACT
MAGLSSRELAAQTLSAVCQPKVTGQVVVATPAERLAAGRKAQPPITDIYNGFAWPDTPLGVIKTDTGYEFFASDGGYHARQMWQGKWVGNNKAGSVVTTVGTLDKPLGSGDPLDVGVSPNPNSAVNPNYSSYGYIGGGPVYQVPSELAGPGHLLATYHAELPKDALYAALGLAASSDNGQHWTDLGEIIRLNQAYAVGLDGYEIGDGPLVLSPDGKYFYLYFPDWLANGSLHVTNAGGASTTTNVSVARAPVAAVLAAAFGTARSPVQPELSSATELAHPHTVAFEKFYEGQWDLQPAIGGASTDLIPSSAYQGYLDIHYNSELKRYVMLISNDTQFGYAESVDALHWTVPTLLGVYGPIAAYPTAVGLGDDPHILGKQFYVYFTHLLTDGSGWTEGSLQRLTLTCP